ncbi:sigma 54-interacting transcriptional regulator [bacterium 210820-DFI.6.37]|nr:sigma 54-interacting transcriptional regulator [bacterium 210820-DFI.6.37]
MNVNDTKDYELYLEHVPGIIATDLTGTIMYLNQQCADYLGVDRELALGSKVYDVFPDTKMMENMGIDRPTIMFYHSFGIGISVHIPIMENGEKIGLLEYDVVQASEVLYELADNYTKFLDEELTNLRKEINQLRRTKYSIGNIIGKSPAILSLKEAIQRAARSDSTVVIFGETGTGKELVAQSIHDLSKRAKQNLIKINAANLPETLVESELFGYESGAFTGARKNGKKGKFELADKGTLFIDEINQMSLSVQPKLLRALQENEIERVGGENSITVDTRVIVTSNQDLRELVKKGKFRQDLFYRLHVIPVIVPPLRDRKEDIPALVEYFAQRYSEALGKTITEIDPKIYARLQQYNWPGNVRELQNVIERAIAFSKDNYLSAADIHLGNRKLVGPDMDSENPIETAKKKVEIEMIVEALKTCDGNKTEAAKLLKIPRPLLYQKIKRLGIVEPIT